MGLTSCGETYPSATAVARMNVTTISTSAAPGPHVIKVTKRDGRTEAFNTDKLYESILKAVKAASLPEEGAYNVFVDVVSKVLEGEAKDVATATISDSIEKALIQRVIEDRRWEVAAKHYVLARIYNHVFGKGAWNAIDPEDLKYSFNALKVLEARYLVKDPNTLRLKETPSMMIKRVARFLAEVERRYGKTDEEVEAVYREFCRILGQLKFMPNSPTLMNAGTRLGVLSACFVIPVRDAMTTPEGEGIMDALRAAALITKEGGGTGFDFSELRPEGDVVASTAGVASGPLSFMKMFDTVTDVIKQGGRRRGANMGVLHVWHPDVEKFIESKSGALKDVQLQNFNISVAVYDEFMRRVEEGGTWPLINPRKTFLGGEDAYDSRLYAVVKARHSINEDWVREVIVAELEEKGGSVALDATIIVTLEEALAIAEREGAITRYVDARELFRKIVTNAWDSGDPGLIFIDEVNRRHPTWYLGKITATNPCSEEPLLPWENCNLGSINLEKYVRYDSDGRPRVDWDGIARDVAVAVRFLDNVIDASRHPLPQIEKANKFTRKIGLGVMGWARFLIRLGVPYDSPEAVHIAWRVAEWIAYNAYRASVELAKERGPFPAWNPKLYRLMWRTRRFRSPEDLLNAAGLSPWLRDERVKKLLSEAPEPDWDSLEKEILKYGLRNATVLSIAPTGSISIIAGTSSGIEPLFALAFVRAVSVGTFVEVDDLFIEELAKYELDYPELIAEIAKHGAVGHLHYIPKSVKRVFRTALEVDFVWHVLHQAAWQQWVDAAVSKTVNLRSDEPVESVWNVYILAWKLGCKGITIYRDRSKSAQVIYFGLKAVSGEGPQRNAKGFEARNLQPVASGGMPRRAEKRQVRPHRQVVMVRLGKELAQSGPGGYGGRCPLCDL